jgi:hypothetical protein
MELTQRRQAISRIYQPSALSNDSLLNSALGGKNSMMSTFSAHLTRSLSDPASVLTDLEEHKVSSTVSVKKVRRFDIANMDNIQNLNEIKNTYIKSFNSGDDNDGNNSSIQRPTVTVLGMNRLPNTVETNKRRSSMISTAPSKTAQINLTKLSRIKSTTNRRPRASSVGNVSVIHVDKSSIKMQPIGNRSETSMPATNHKMNTGNGVRVTKLSRRLGTTQSHFT